jgi:hypothetical protein
MDRGSEGKGCAIMRRQVLSLHSIYLSWPNSAIYLNWATSELFIYVCDVIDVKRMLWCSGCDEHSLGAG